MFIVIHLGYLLGDKALKIVAHSLSILLLFSYRFLNIVLSYFMFDLLGDG